MYNVQWTVYIQEYTFAKWFRKLKHKDQSWDEMKIGVKMRNKKDNNHS